MARLHHRPRISLIIPHPPDIARAHLDRGIANQSRACVGRSGQRHAFLEIQPDLRHFWSPTLDIVLRDHPEGTRLLGRFGPSPSIWTATMFVYGISATLSLGATSVALAQRIAQEPATALVLIPITAALALGTFLSTRVGALLGHHQMRWLARALRGLGRVEEDDAQVLPTDSPTEAPQR